MSRAMFRLNFVAALLASLVAAGAAGTIHATDIMEVERHVWTDSVDPSTREAVRAHTPPIRLRQVYLWTQLKGSKELLEKMRANSDGQVRIRHLWQRYDSDQLVVDFDVPLGVGRKEELRKLAYEVDALGFFRWRVWSHKESLTRG